MKRQVKVAGKGGRYMHRSLVREVMVQSGVGRRQVGHRQEEQKDECLWKRLKAWAGTRPAGLEAQVRTLTPGPGILEKSNMVPLWSCSEDSEKPNSNKTNAITLPHTSTRGHHQALWKHRGGSPELLLPGTSQKITFQLSHASELIQIYIVK